MFRKIDEVIEIANKFINDNNINLDNYGEPVISYDFRKDYEENEDISLFLTKLALFTRSF